MVPVLVVAGLSLLALPAVIRPFGRRLAPSEWSWLCIGALVVGAAVLQLSFVLYAAPTVLRAVGIPEWAEFCERALGFLLPGRSALGWPAATAAVAFPAFAGRGALRAFRSQRILHVEPWLGEHRRFADHAVVVLPTDRLLAVCSNGPTPQIVVSAGLVAALPTEELDAVLRHEAVHIEQHHQRFLVVVGALSHSLGFLAFVRRSTAVLRLALERWADEAAAGAGQASRTVLRRALLGVTTAMLGPAVAAFSDADTVAERLTALNDEPPRPSALRRVATYAPVVVISATILGAVGSWAGEAHHVLTWASHHCP